MKEYVTVEISEGLPSIINFQGRQYFIQTCNGSYFREADWITMFHIVINGKPTILYRDEVLRTHPWYVIKKKVA